MYIGDLHIHSRYSRATSKEGTPEHLDMWARKKGIGLVGTGDFTHPAWREELKEKLVPAEDGLYRLKEEYILEDHTAAVKMQPRFVVSGEISSIYKKNDKVRKVHSLILLPGLEEADRLAGKLETIGNIHSDGRPILGLDCRDLLEIMMEIAPRGIFIPAHIWTPHFSMFGAFSGFRTVEECFEDMAPYIHALETGLSSDPPMNWRLSALDSYQLVSNSDAHSPAKLGREANLFNGELSYDGLERAIQTGDGLEGTIEFFPEEGKYHYDGHRKCHICLSPSQAEAYGGRCPVCGRKMTLGVDHRVKQLADREEGYVRKDGKRFESMVPLPEVIGASTGRSAAGTAVQEQYERLLKKLGPEFQILREIPEEDIRKEAGYLISEGIRRLRAGEVKRVPGFDGEYGTIKLFEPGEIDNLDGQMSLFAGFGLETGGTAEERLQKSGKRQEGAPDKGEGRKTKEKQSGESGKTEETRGSENRQAEESPDAFNEEQQEAIHSVSRVTAVTAGPGTGKTRTLMGRILWLLENRKVKASEITAVTFTNQAAEEMRERLRHYLGNRSAARIRIGTFHSICYEMLKKRMEFTLAEEAETLEIWEEIRKELDIRESPKELQRQVSLRKTGRNREEEKELPGEGPESEKLEQAFSNYHQRLREKGLFDFDDLLLEGIKLEEDGAEKQFSYLFVDEFQDISPIQYDLIRKWNKNGRELFVIGDEDQAIYGFRGADGKCFERLFKDWEEVRTIRLKKNYRSSSQIVKGAAGVIEKNPGPKRELLAVKGEGYPIRIVQAKGEMAEGIFVAKEINRLVGGMDMLDAEQLEDDSWTQEKISFADIAVLYRTHRQAALLEKCLQKEGIPYVVTGREEFLEERLVRGSLCFFKSLLDPKDGLARKTALKLLWNLSEDCIAGSVYEAMAEKYSRPVKKEKPQKLLEQWMDELALLSPEKKEQEGMEKLISMAVFHKTMEEFLEQLALGQERDLRRCGGKVYKADSVTLMTIHGAKGLEFPAVILYGAKKGLLPLESSRGDTNEEEERRLFYVAMTRAEQTLILTTAKEASPFLQDIPEQEAARESLPKKKEPERAVQLSLFDFNL